MFLFWMILGCPQTPPELLHSQTTYADQESHATYMGYVDRDFLVDAVGEEATAACEERTATAQEGTAGCGVWLGGCMTISPGEDGNHLLMLNPSQCEGWTAR